MLIKYKIPLYILIISFLIVGVSGSFVYFSVKSALQGTVASHQRETALQMMDKIDRFLFFRLADIETISGIKEVEDYLAVDNSPAAAEGDLAKARRDIEKRLADFKRNYGVWEELTIVDSQGIEIISTDKEEVGGNLVQDPDYQTLWRKVQQGEIVYSDLFIDRETGKPTMVFMAPVVRTDFGREIIGAVEGHLFWSVVLEMIEGIEQTVVNLYNKDGFLIGSNEPAHKEDILSDAHKEEEVVRHALESEPMSMIMPSSHGAPKSLVAHVIERGFLRYSGNNWVLILETPTSVAFAGAVKIAKNIMLFSVIFVFWLVVLSLILIHQKLSAPLGFLSKTAEKISGGDFSLRIKTKTKDEIGRLGESFNVMTAKLKESFETLERKVRERTKELDAANKELKQAITSEQALYNKLKTVLEISPVPVILLDAAARLVFANKLAREVFDLTSETVGKDAVSRFPFILEYRSKMKPGEACQASFEHNNRFYNVVGAVLGSKKAPECVALFWDLTREREIDRQKTEFVSITAHELRTPVNAFKWSLEMLKAKETGRLNKTQKVLAEEMYESALRLLDLVEDLLNVTRLEEKRLTIKPESVIIENIVEKTFKEFEAEAKAKKLYLKIIKPEKPLSKVLADPSRLRQILSNLIGNALKFTEKGGVEVRVEILKGVVPNLPGRLGTTPEALISIKDTGLGIPKEEQKRIFERFFRSSLSEKKQISGTGLGLYITKQLVELQGGKIWFESEEGKGTIFHFTLPVS